MEQLQEKVEEKPITTYQELKWERVVDGIVAVWFDTPGKKVNLLSVRMLDELEAVLDELARRPEVKAIIFISAKSDNFIAGADLTVALSEGFSPEKAVALGNRGRAVFQKLADLKVPTIAAIHGTCLGGGTELALACDFRVATTSDKTKIGLPEVQLGILPAWGGSQRLPRLVPLSRALDMLLTGKRLEARKARQIGLVDLAPPPELLLPVCAKLAKEALAGQTEAMVAKRADRQGVMERLALKLPIGRNLIFSQARKNVMRKTKGRYPAPLKILEIVQEGMFKPLAEAFRLESAAFKELVEKPETHSLMNLFLISQELGKVPAAEAKGLHPRPIQAIGVLGAGVMGAGIAQLANYRGAFVRLKDIDNQALAKGLQAIHKVYGSLLRKKKIKPKEVEDRMRQVTATTDYSGFKKMDLVIEAIVERLDVKKAVFAELEPHLAEAAILASNTSSLSINAMAAVTQRPDRFLGLHFFNPVHKMPLVEVIPGDQTSEETLLTAVEWVKKLGKTPIIVKDSPGFLVNRILAVYGNEACLLLEEGSDVATIDRVMVDYGMPMGFFTMADMAGIDVGYHAGQSMRVLFEQREGFQEARILERLFGDQRFGVKSGQGFYIHQGQTAIPDYRYLETALAQVRPEAVKREIPPDEIRERLVLIMLNEAALCLEEQLVRNPGEIDMALIMGTGFPPFRGGLFRQVDLLGAAPIVKLFEGYAAKYGARFRPHPMLVEMAQSNRKFYPYL